MHRPLYSRVFSLALSLWLPLFMSGSESIVRCPTHGEAVAVAANAAPSGDAAAEHAHAADHSAPAEHDGGHACSCPGPGCCPPAVAVVPGAELPMSHVVAVHEATAVSALERFASENDHLLPFATAPPAVALAPAASTVA